TITPTTNNTSISVAPLSCSLSARRKKEQDKGATLMEVLLVVGVIVVLAASAYKLYSMVQVQQ
ncbi:hypothetical protein PSZ11_23735, partial [Shigella flexneri]|nr:hypothetical protein [Shigella flexneri]